MIVTGTVTILVNGKSIRTKEGSGELDLGGFEREAAIADGQVIGPTQKVVPGRVKATGLHTNDTDMDEIADMTDGTILFKTDTGQNYTVRTAFCKKPPVLKAGGDIEYEFEGKRAVPT